MKKTITLLLAISMLFLLIACNKDSADTETNSSTITQSSTNKENDEKNNSSESSIEEDNLNKGYITSKDAFVAKTNELLDLSLYDDLDEYDGTSLKSYYYAITSENKREYDLDYKIELDDGTEFTMPITFDELASKGWILQKSSDPDREIKSGFMTLGTVENEDGKILSVSAYNPTNTTISFKDCTVTSVYLKQYSDLYPKEKLNDTIDFTICETLTNASTLEDIINKLGNPYSIYYTWHHDDNENYTYSTIEITYMQKSSAYSQLIFKLSGDGNYIINAKYDIEPK